MSLEIPPQLDKAINEIKPDGNGGTKALIKVLLLGVMVVGAALAYIYKGSDKATTAALSACQIANQAKDIEIRRLNDNWRDYLIAKERQLDSIVNRMK